MPAYDEDAGSGGTLFIFGDNGVLFGVDPATGIDRWPPVAVGFANGNVAVANGLVYTGGGAGGVPIVTADSGTLLVALAPQTPAKTFSGVVVSGGVIYSVAGPYLNAWSASSSGPAPGRKHDAQGPGDSHPRSPIRRRLARHDRGALGPLPRGPRRDPAGVGGTVNFLNLTIRDAASGTAAKVTTAWRWPPRTWSSAPGRTRSRPPGSLSFDMAVDYFLLSGGRP